MPAVEDKPECPVIDEDKDKTEKQKFPNALDIVLIIVLVAALWLILSRQ